MNSLTWFLYLADVLHNFSGFLVGFCLILGFVTFMNLIFTASYNDDYEVEEGKIPRKSYKISFALTSIIFILAVVASFMPSKRTMYMMAASELGGKVLDDPRNQEMLEIVRSWVKQELINRKEDASKSK